jgi:hypothetical protein
MALDTGFVGVKQVAVYERGAKESIYRWGDSKGFPAHRMGPLLRFKLSEVGEWRITRCGDAVASAVSGKMTEARPGGRKRNVKKNRRHG